MLVRDRLLLVALAAVWGLNFTIIRFALHDFPPLMLGALRFALVALPAVFVLPAPRGRWRHWVGYGLLMFAVQFSLLFAGMHLGTPAGVASVLLQSQVFVTIGLALWLGKERPSGFQLAGVAVAALGLACIAADTLQATPAPGLLLVLLAAVSWGVANTLSKRVLGTEPVLSLVAWGSLVSAPVVGLLSLLVEGSQAWSRALAHSSVTGWLSVAYIVYPTTLAGFALWAWQLRRYPAAKVAPFTLLVPVFGLSFAALFAGEALTPMKVGASALVVGGLVLTQWGARILQLLSSTHRRAP